MRSNDYYITMSVSGFGLLLLACFAAGKVAALILR